ncbi:MAG: hypothetical protein IPF41_05150 [Flavobacteriales bacterium]|nr:hypothetical protein [Flavobacteriales bacterium]
MSSTPRGHALGEAPACERPSFFVRGVGIVRLPHAPFFAGEKEEQHRAHHRHGRIAHLLQGFGTIVVACEELRFAPLDRIA